MKSEDNKGRDELVNDITCAHLITTFDDDDDLIMNQQINEIKYWLKCALIMTPDKTLTCERRMFIENYKEIKYYDMGKIFRFNNIISATDDEDEEPEYEFNVVFHIYTHHGKSIR